MRAKHKNETYDKDTLIKLLKDALKAGKRIPLGVPYYPEIVNEVSIYGDSVEKLHEIIQSLTSSLKNIEEENMKSFMEIAEDHKTIYVISFYNEIPRNIKAEFPEKELFFNKEFIEYLSKKKFKFTYEQIKYCLTGRGCAGSYSLDAIIKNIDEYYFEISIDSAQKLLEEVAHKTLEVAQENPVDKWLND